MKKTNPSPGVKTREDREDAGMPKPPAKPVSEENRETRGEKPKSE